jgi:hypothetical protein
MTISSINVGNIANDGTGDDLREAFIKVNDNFTELDSSISNFPIDVENLGGSGEGIFASKINSTIQFKEIIGGTNTTVSSNNSSIIIDTDGGLDNFFVLTPNGSMTVDKQQDLRFEGDDVISVRSNGLTVFVEVDGSVVSKDSSPSLSGNLQANGNNIQNVSTINANSFIGPLTGTVDGVNVGEIGYYFNNFDFGGVFPEVNNILDYLIATTEVDLGAFLGEEVVEFDIDFGSI